MYAAGEIVLVVLGILIALQINNWNQDRQNRKQERSYLVDIKENLIIDKMSAEGHINYNAARIAAIDSMLQLLNSAKKTSDYVDFLIKNQRLFATFPTFDPVRTTFENMISSHSIDIIQNKDLRIALSDYYNYDWEKSPQSVVRSSTRSFARVINSKLIGEPVFHRNFEENFKPMLVNDTKFNWIDDFEMEFQDPDYLEFHHDREAIASMFTLIPTAIYHNNWMTTRGIEKIDRLLEMIEEEVSPD